MKKNNLLITFGILFLFGITIAPSVNGAITTVTSEADKDSYVTTSNPTTNYGGADWLIFGYYITDFAEAYLHFNFTDKPANFTKAEITIDMYSISATVNLTASIITDSWSETGITWVNKPDHGQVISAFTASTEQVYSIDVTNFITGTGISICINATDFTQTAYVQARSSEGGYSWSTLLPTPKLVWTYNAPDTQIPGFNILILLGSMLGITLFIIRKYKLKK